MHILQRGSFLNQKKLSCRSQIWWIACQQLRGCTFALSGGCTKLLTKSPQSHLWRFKKHHSKHIFSDFFFVSANSRVYGKAIDVFLTFFSSFSLSTSFGTFSRHHEVYRASFKKQFTKIASYWGFFCPFFSSSRAIIRKRLLTSTDAQLFTSGASLVVCLFNLHAWVVFFNFPLSQALSLYSDWALLCVFTKM